MVSLVYIVVMLFLLCQHVRNEFHLYYMDRTDYSGLYYDCLYFEVIDNSLQSILMDENVKKWYEIIPYCIRPFSETDAIHKNLEGNISSRLTFEELRKKQVTIHDLLLWSASVDLIERYDDYLNSSADNPLKLETFYNCSLSWFGPFCRYTFDTYSGFNTTLSFPVIVNKTFADNRFSNITNITCYLHSTCNRGPTPACLDWREICDGKVDCLDNDIDEIDCFELEINQCEENEFRCHNGMCIPEEFLNEGTYYPDCFDGTDEDFRISKETLVDVPLLLCEKDPGYWCEETDWSKTARYLVCGDGQRTDESILYTNFPWGKPICKSSRDIIIKNALLSYIEHSDVSYDCWFILKCSTIGTYELYCDTLCEDDNDQGCYINITDYCQTDFVIFPQRSIIQGHVKLVYLTNRTILFISQEISMFPDYVCYDIEKCPFLPSESLLNVNSTTCRSTEEFGLKTFIDIMNFFQACLIVVNKKLEMNSTSFLSSSLFQCPGTTKYISKERVLDGIPDCYKKMDEINIDTCKWNNRHRFTCPSENKCLSHILIRNGIRNCLEGEDEKVNAFKDISFQTLCNGYEHRVPVLINGFNETDETHCNNWPCNNLYTRCDGAWNCPNGADENNCRSTYCPQDTHECVLPVTMEITCLPVHRAGDGIIDCLGSTDERNFCRLRSPTNVKLRYRCLNEDVCVNSIDVCCNSICFHEEDFQCSDNITLIFDRLLEDKKLQYPDYEYFILEPFTTTTSISEINKLPTLNKKFSIRRTETCNRGIVIYTGSKLTISCLCPPSYYGDRCQYQSERISLTLQFSRLCTPQCHGIFAIIITLIDQDSIIHDYEQLTYTSTYKCANKYFIYLLYQSRPKDRTKTYNIRIDAYEKMNLTYYSSWLLPVKFLFLPVNRIAAHLLIPAQQVSNVSNCSILCVHGQCFTYMNNPKEYFCRCDPGWFGVGCTISRACNCSSDSKCLGHINNQSICLCTLEKYGRRCRIPSVCQNNSCLNAGTCLPDDQRISRNRFICLCPPGYFGTKCELNATEIHISFSKMDIPRSLRTHFISIRRQADPLHTTVSTKIPYDRDFAVVHISVSYHIIIVQILNDYYLLYVNANYTYASFFESQIETKQQCLHIEQLFDNKTIARYPLLLRVKYYHLLCKNLTEIKCFHDNEQYMCLCHEQGYANCFPFQFNTTDTCKKLGDCQNNAQCLIDRSICPNSIFCACSDCYYGSKCQFSTKGFGLSLDAILGYHIRPHVSINHQPVIIKISIAMTVIMLIIGLINSIISILTFRKDDPGASGCRQYLLATSVMSLFITIIFSLKFIMLILSQMSIITNSMTLRIFCITIDFLLRLGPILSDWINASIAVERALTLILDVNFNLQKSRQAVRWVIIAILLFSICSILHQPINQTIIYDEEEDRRWCLVQYSSSLEIYNSSINVIHFFIPFVINFITGILIIFIAARKRSRVVRNQSYQEILNKQFHTHKHLIISSIILVILATPRLIISFTYGCMKSARNPTLYLVGYFISFIPPSLTFIIFILPSKIFMARYYVVTKRVRTMFDT